jgi:RNA 2',3'-cyclic 3'-phosphodiesterase
MRAFLAIEIEDKLKDILSDLIARLEPMGHGISWIKPEQMHLTLWFFEDLREEMLQKVSGSIEQSAEANPPFNLEIKKTGSFGSAGHPRVFWCGFAGDIAALNGLYSGIESGLSGIGVAGDGKPFRPHLTLGRNKSGARQERVSSFLHGLKDYSVGIFKVKELTLFRSELLRGGAVHTPLKRFVLGGGS